jgi:hypothetical protein
MSISVFAQSSASMVVQSTQPQALEAQATQTLLPDDFPVYTKDIIVTNHPAQGFEKKVLPTNNDYKNNPGCYIACYSRDKSSGIYTLGDNIYVNGQVRVAGMYKGRMCVPTGYETKNISTEASFKVQCARISTCSNNQCWASGDTGGWFGIP